ncbi:ABC transporter [Streptomyces sp. NBC_01565]|uniref:ABC transporter n=1 Tax=unclassified Streptomyces TaxID=2593676 RepID=UPI0022593670|nr:ABC transporter [Streptomyces sp. NBC_01565]MCX4540704.1 ABC transporter [Streptomyces sp. NBC_01565]
MTALLRYQGALLLRSQRWLAPVLLYAAFLAVGFRPGDPVPDSLGYAAAALVPVTAWLVRICVTVEPDAARDCAAAAAGPVRAHAAALLTGLGWGFGAGVLGAVAVLLLGDRAGTTLPAAALAGASAVLVCALTGAAVGALCARPLLRAPGYAVGAAGLGCLLALVTAGSPARVAVSALVGGSVALPLGALAGAAVTACAAGVAACLVAARRG